LSRLRYAHGVTPPWRLPPPPGREPFFDQADRPVVCGNARIFEDGGDSKELANANVSEVVARLLLGSTSEVGDYS
jgi:hypothetical protein